MTLVKTSQCFKPSFVIFFNYIKLILNRLITVMLGLCETIDQLAMVSSVRWYGHVLRRVDGRVLRRALDFEVEGQRKKGRPKRTWKKQFEVESVMDSLRREDALCRSKWSVGVNQIAAGLR